jgi:hypothetical protein
MFNSNDIPEATASAGMGIPLSLPQLPVEPQAVLVPQSPDSTGNDWAELTTQQFLDEPATFRMRGQPAWVPEAMIAVNIEAPKIGKILFMGDFPLSWVTFAGGGAAINAFLS